MADEKRILRTGQALAGLFPLAKIDPKDIRTIMAKYDVPGFRNSETGFVEYEMLPAIQAIICYFKDDADKRFSAAADDRARLAKTNADNAELEGMKMRGEVVMLTDAKAWWAGERIEVKRTVERSEFLTPTQKTKLLLSLGRIQTKGP